VSETLRLIRLGVGGFRNLEAQVLTPHPRFTRVVGENGQGKTNLLEAAHYALTLRPLRVAKLAELIRHGETEADVNIELNWGGNAHHLGAQLDSSRRPTSRVLLREKKPVAASDYLLAGATVAFTPEDLQIVRAGPERRRRFLDRAVFNRWPAYLGEVRNYQRLLKTRNAMLREHAARSVREVFEESLWVAGAKIVQRRHALLDELRALSKDAFARIGLVDVPLQLRYKGLSDAGSVSASAEAFAKEAAARIELDLDRGFTSVGPHTEDLAIQLGGRSARLYASQGQTRALVLALKIAEIENLREKIGHAPILLLDDVSSELDPKRNQSFMRYLRDLPAQVLLSTTDDAALSAALEGQSTRWLMAQGTVKTE
jgi:DNA replication and repair protein RecF